MFILYPDGRTETILIRLEGKDDERFFSQDKPLLELLQRLYQDGWTIESELYHDPTLRGIYILKRTVR